MGKLDPNVVYVTLALEGACWMAHRSDRPGEWEYVGDRMGEGWAEWWRQAFPETIPASWAARKRKPTHRRVTTWCGSTLIHVEVRRG